MRAVVVRQSAIEQQSAFVHGARRLLNHGASDGSVSAGGTAIARIEASAAMAATDTARKEVRRKLVITVLFQSEECAVD